MELTLTFDLDWVDDWVLEKTIEILSEYEVKATFFVTHKSKLVKSLKQSSFEIALHPNYGLANGNYNENAFMNLLKLYPDARGVRSHSLLFGSRFIREYEQNGMLYESNCFLYKHNNLEIVNRSANLKTIPFNWSDDKHIELEKNFSLQELPSLANAGLNIFNFHPIHVFLNTKSEKHYQLSKPDFNTKNLYKHVNLGSGVQTLLIKLCQKIKAEKIKTLKLLDRLDIDS